ncbi:MAG: acyl-CoA dehydrogenase N-terminal domain-containing protein, partial [SAR324 cluster bacterium]|nr:acyl-CoA dehydrogenase N-terminal domain-containing protein [SAR324 cluster bacterium]
MNSADFSADRRDIKFVQKEFLQVQQLLELEAFKDFNIEVFDQQGVTDAQMDNTGMESGGYVRCQAFHLHLVHQVLHHAAFGNALGRVLVIPLFFAAAYFLVALFIYYRGTYDPPAAADIQFEEITTPLSAHTIFTEQPEVRSGLLVIDGAHDNDFS